MSQVSGKTTVVRHKSSVAPIAKVPVCRTAAMYAGMKAAMISRTDSGLMDRV